MAIEINKKGQLAIFIIIAIAIVFIVVAAFLVYRLPSISTRGGEFSPESFLDNCVREEARDTIALMMPQGGFVEPKDYKISNDTKATYLCKNVNYYYPCIVQYPAYISSVSNELTEQIKPKIENCFLVLEKELDKRGYQHEGGEMTLSNSLVPDRAMIKIERSMTISKNGESKTYSKFDINFPTSLYNLAYIAQEIMSQEAHFCYFEYVGYSALYPRYSVTKKTLSDSTRVYTIKDKRTNSIMNIAIRGCAIPAGL